MAIEYGVKPEGMSDGDWTLECQARMVARMTLDVSATERQQIMEQWSKLPGVTPKRVMEIHQELREQK
ncbi:hypothetical protein R5R73_04820 [Salinicola sp. LHM]|uniref:hypothetical protein n=1 Tax=Salinicola sp. LHM TaxID=3065298 RepID=UPI002ACE6B01|nr:hypothetical protein [Salinicola sp. LHM]WQH34012.1 hypothetical protein R5R73_04820 [Salinicola sp. LHM]